MKTRFTAVCFAAAATLSCIGCAEKASEEDIDRMCRHLIQLRGEIDLTPMDQKLGQISKDFADRTAKLKQQNTDRIGALETELEEKLASAGTDDEKAKLTEEYTKLKDEAASELNPALAQLEASKAEAIKSAKDKAEAAKGALEEKLATCKVDPMIKDVSKEVASCRIQANDADSFWNKCR
jgi:hypothetical protein